MPYYKIIFLSSGGRTISRKLMARNVSHAEKLAETWAKQYDKAHKGRIVELEAVRLKSAKAKKRGGDLFPHISNAFDVIINL